MAYPPQQPGWPGQQPPQQGYQQQPGYGPPPQQGYGPPPGGGYGPPPAPPGGGYGPPQQGGGWGAPQDVNWDRMYEEGDPGAGSGYTPGDYPFVVDSAVWGPTSKGDKWMWTIKCRFTGGPHANGMITAYRAISEYKDDGSPNAAGIAILFGELRALGIPVGEKYGDPPGTQPYWRLGWTGEQVAQAMVGKNGIVRVENDDRGGKARRIKPATAGQVTQAPAPQPGPPAYGGYQPGPPAGQPAYPQPGPQPGGYPPQAGQPGTGQFTPGGQGQQPWNPGPPAQGPPQQYAPQPGGNPYPPQQPQPGQPPQAGPPQQPWPANGAPPGQPAGPPQQPQAGGAPPQPPWAAQ
jgi:hypothetical protein